MRGGVGPVRHRAEGRRGAANHRLAAAAHSPDSVRRRVSVAWRRGWWCQGTQRALFLSCDRHVTAECPAESTQSRCHEDRDSAGREGKIGL